MTRAGIDRHRDSFRIVPRSPGGMSHVTLVVAQFVNNTVLKLAAQDFSQKKFTPCMELNRWVTSGESCEKTSVAGVKQVPASNSGFLSCSLG